MVEPVKWGGPCSLCGNQYHDGPTYESIDKAFERRVCAMLNEHPGLSPRHAVMFVQGEDIAADNRRAALEWEREKGRAFAAGMREVP